MNKRLPEDTTFLIDFNGHWVPAALGLEVPPAAQAAMFKADAATLATYRQAVQTQVRAVGQKLLAHRPLQEALDAWSLEKGDSVLFLGDSITTYLYSYARLLESMVTQRRADDEVTFINGAQSGYTSTHGLEAAFTQYLPLQPDWVFIKYGVNDCKQFGGEAAKTLVSAEEYRANVKTMIEAFQAGGARIILLTPTPVVEAVANEKPDFQTMRMTWDNGNLEAFATIVRDLGHEHGLPVVDLMAVFGNEPDAALYLDGLHPAPPGQQKILEAVLGVLGEFRERT